jgi:hypothetical protein
VRYQPTGMTSTNYHSCRLYFQRQEEHTGAHAQKACRSDKETCAADQKRDGSHRCSRQSFVQMANGPKSNGATTGHGRLTIVDSHTTNAARCFEPWLPGIETQEERAPNFSSIRTLCSSLTSKKS